MKFYCLSVILLVAVFVGEGCKSSTTDPGTNSAIIAPKVGNFFVYDVYYIDTLGTKIVGVPYLEEEMDTVTVVGSGITYQGRTNVVNTTSTGSFGAWFMNFESTGDVSIWQNPSTHTPFVVHGGWRTFPVTTKGGSNYVLVDSVVQQSGQPDWHGYETVSINYVGVQDITVGAETLTCEKFDLINNGQYGNHDITGTDTTSMLFSSKLGAVVHTEPRTKIIHVPAGKGVFRTVSALVGYSLK